MNFELGPAGEAAMRLVFTEVPQPALTKALIEIENQLRNEGRLKAHFIEEDEPH